MTGRTTGKRIERAGRRTRALELRTQGETWAAVARGAGYSSAAAACRDVGRLLAERIEAQALAADQLREVELDRLDALYRKVWEVLEREHVTVSGGKVVMVEDGSGEMLTLRDDGPTLAAVDRLLKIGERRAKLLGLDSEVKVDAGVTVRYEVTGVDMDALR